MNKYNEEKSRQLGLNASTAQNQLRKLIVFNLVKKCDLDTCYRCGQKIETVEDLSFDHKIDWLYKENAKELFFDVENIAFSHKSCNYSARGMTKAIRSKSGAKGIYLDRGKYKVEVTFMENGKQRSRNFGRFDTLEEAIAVHNEKVVLIHGDRAITNEMIATT